MAEKKEFRESKAGHRLRPELIIHAGTHKTASTYIQERLHRNSALLLELGFDIQDPQNQKPKPKKLVADLCKRRWNRWQRMFESRDRNRNLLLSAEQFAVPLTSRECISNLQSLARKNGYSLHIVIFIRSQLDYINSRYTYSLRRFYHNLSFEEFVHEALHGRLSNERPQRGSVERRQDVFDFWSYFQALLEAKQDGLKVTFLPFRQGGIDPFEQFISALGLSTKISWKSCESRHFNRSPGTRGVWMARLLSKRLQDKSIPVKSIRDSSQIILKEERRRCWNDPAFWGFSKHLRQRVTLHYSRHNNQFAKAAWGTSWQSAFPDDSDLKQRKRSVYSPASIGEELRMHAIGAHLLRRIQKQRKRKPWHLLTEPIESASNLIFPSLTHALIKAWESVSNDQN